jgi:hypothetical protein
MKGAGVEFAIRRHTEHPLPCGAEKIPALTSHELENLGCQSIVERLPGCFYMFDVVIGQIADVIKVVREGFID